MSTEVNKISESDPENSGVSKEKICKVCGDKALGYNFNAITCESCKAFFRRNALKDKEFKCPFNKKCEITPITRRFCQLCRLIKCFEIGMRKEYIMSEDDKREKRKKIELNRAIKKRTAEEFSDDSSESSSKHMKCDRSSEEECEEVKKEKKFAPSKLNLLNMASTSRKTYQKKQMRYNTNIDQMLSSPAVPEPSSPGGGADMASRTCNVFDESVQQFDSTRSRSLEIYEISKVAERRRENPVYEENRADSSIIKTILNAELPRTGYDVHEEKSSSKGGGADFLFDESKLIELAKNNKHLVLETTKDGSKILLITKEGLSGNSRSGKSSENDGYSLDRSDNCNGESSSMPLLSSLITGDNGENTSHGLNFRKNVAEEVLQDIPRYSGLNSIDSILSEAIKLEYEAYTSMNSRMNSRELNDAERAKLNELIVANKALLAPLDDDINGLMGEDLRFYTTATCGRPMLVDVLNLTAVAIRRLIKMSKKVNAFKNMCQEDQIALLKGCCTEMMILRSAMTYDSDRETWQIPHSKEKLMNIKVDVLKEAGGKVFEEHQRFLQTFDPKWRYDENIMLILSAITLFTPDRPRVVHYDVIKLEQNSYYYLLRRYLESVYRGCEARSTFLKLIHKISELRRLNEDHVRVYLDVNPKDVEPLLIEIFDLKPH
ncbi:UNVERIFIED_CONTAM: hypothetical protein PYX00_004151 [Menopon gallinae]|uniref:Nuclear hormone receptor HR96 n=1 Tax=Menopon gallinae TaxID=328185 RepID=A0AAW2I4I5_9NEOP